MITDKQLKALEKERNKQVAIQFCKELAILMDKYNVSIDMYACIDRDGELYDHEYGIIIDGKEALAIETMVLDSKSLTV